MDSAGATQLHGIPGVFGALAAGIIVIASTNNQYDINNNNILVVMALFLSL